MWLTGMLQNAKSPHTDDIFGAHVLPAHEQLRQYCVRHLQSTEVFNNAVAPLHSDLDIPLTTQQHADLQLAMSNATDDRTRYTLCLAKLEEIIRTHLQV